MLRLLLDYDEPFSLPWDKEIEARYPKPKMLGPRGKPYIDLADGVRINRAIAKTIAEHPHKIERLIVMGSMADHRNFQEFLRSLIVHNIQYRHQILVDRPQGGSKSDDKCRFFYFFKDSVDTAAAKVLL